MDAKGFLQHVVPWNLGGYVTIHWHRPGKPFLGRSCQTLEDALQCVEDLKSKTDFNIYFCVSLQRLNGGHRDREHAMYLVCIPMDMDIKSNSDKHYSSMAEAIASLFWFCDQAGIPRPSMLVFSGGGLHAYWLSDRALTVDEWQPYADAVKNAAMRAGLKFDRQCTWDAARVLRVPETNNWKYETPRQVRMLQKYCTAEKINFAEAFKDILGLTSASGPKAAAPKVTVAEAFQVLPVTPLSDTILKDIPPLPVKPILDVCGWLREAYETGGRGFDNPQWNLTTLI